MIDEFLITKRTVPIVEWAPQKCNTFVDSKDVGDKPNAVIIAVSQANGIEYCM